MEGFALEIATVGLLMASALCVALWLFTSWRERRAEERGVESLLPKPQSSRPLAPGAPIITERTSSQRDRVFAAPAEDLEPVPSYVSSRPTPQAMSQLHAADVERSDLSPTDTVRSALHADEEGTEVMMTPFADLEAHYFPMDDTTSDTDEALPV